MDTVTLSQPVVTGVIDGLTHQRQIAIDALRAIASLNGYRHDTTSFVDQAVWCRGRAAVALEAMGPIPPEEPVNHDPDLRHNYLKRTEAAKSEGDKRGVAAKFKANLVWQGIA